MHPPFRAQNDLQTQLKLHLLQIEERELVYFTENCYNIGTQAALLAGFSFSALMQASAIAGTMNKGIQGGWATMTVLAMVFEIMALVKATQLAITGPGLALRGPEGSMTRAISVMRIEYRKIGQLFYLGLVRTLLSNPNPNPSHRPQTPSLKFQPRTPTPNPNPNPYQVCTLLSNPNPNPSPSPRPQTSNSNPEPQPQTPTPTLTRSARCCRRRSTP